jgi:Ca2+-binding EF-hand superfamily protein
MYIFLTLSTSLPLAKLRELMASTASIATTDANRDRTGLDSCTTDDLPTNLKAKLKELFHAADVDGNGSVDAAEMKALCSKMGVEASDEEIAAEMAVFDLAPTSQKYSV